MARLHHKLQVARDNAVPPLFAETRKFAGNVSDAGSGLTYYPLSSRVDFYVIVEYCYIAPKIVKSKIREHV